MKLSALISEQRSTNVIKPGRTRELLIGESVRRVVVPFAKQVAKEAHQGYDGTPPDNWDGWYLELFDDYGQRRYIEKMNLLLETEESNEGGG